jgi:hypothetical protein
MFNDDCSKVGRIEVATNVLSEALQKLDAHDYSAAQVMVAIARQLLDDVQLDFDRHFQIEGMLQKLLNQSLK